MPPNNFWCSNHTGAFVQRYHSSILSNKIGHQTPIIQPRGFLKFQYYKHKLRHQTTDNALIFTNTDSFNVTYLSCIALKWEHSPRFPFINEIDSFINNN